MFRKVTDWPLLGQPIPRNIAAVFVSHYELADAGWTNLRECVNAKIGKQYPGWSLVGANEVTDRFGYRVVVQHPSLPEIENDKELVYIGRWDG